MTYVANNSFSHRDRVNSKPLSGEDLKGTDNLA